MILRKSADELRSELPKSLHAMRNLVGQVFALHMAAAICWAEGVEILIDAGISKFSRTSSGVTPIEEAISAGSYYFTIEALLKGDFLDYFHPVTRDGGDYSRLPFAFRDAAVHGDPRLQDCLVECLRRHQFLLPDLLPYHDLADYPLPIERPTFAQRLFLAGYKDLETYNSSGYTALMIGCMHGKMEFASFLLQRGADLYKVHERCNLRAGHFLLIDCVADGFKQRKYPDSQTKRCIKLLFESAFDISVETDSICRCSPGGFNPITYTMKKRISYISLKMALDKIISFIEPSPADERRYWRAFIIQETFNRLEMTHTCLQFKYDKFHLSRIESFADNRRIEIENEEINLFFELEEITARFDLFSKSFDGSLSACVDRFLDDLNIELHPPEWIMFGGDNPGMLLAEPKQSWIYKYHSFYSNQFDTDLLKPGKGSSIKVFFDSRGRRSLFDHKEVVDEESMLRWLFPD